MPNKLTDAEVKKALEWHLNEVNHCDGCPLFVLKNTTTYCVDVLMQNALDLINRYEAEVERLKEDIKILRVSVEQAPLIRKDGKSPLSLLTAEIKAEAYKEFAERFKKKLSQKYTTSLWKVYCEEIDNLLNELVGDGDGKDS